MAMPLILKGEFMDDMPEAVFMLVVFQVRNQFLYVEMVLQERAPGGEVEVANDFVDGDLAGDVAAFGGLVLDFFGPVFCDALNGRRGG